MIELKGKYNSAKIFATTVENEVKEQVLEMLNLKAFERRLKLLHIIHLFLLIRLNQLKNMDIDYEIIILI